jgi:peptide/nickel transport system permease protein
MKHKLLAFLRRFALLLLVVWTVVSLVTLLIELVPGDPAIAILGDQATPEQIAQFRQVHGLYKPAFFITYPVDEKCQQAYLPREFTGKSFIPYLRYYFTYYRIYWSGVWYCGHFQWNGWDNRYKDYWVNLLRGDMGDSFRVECPSNECPNAPPGTMRPVRNMILERYPSTIELALSAMFVAVLIAIPLGVFAGKNRGTIFDNVSSVIALVGISLPGFVIGPLLVYLFAVKFRIFNPTYSGDPSDIVLPAFTLGAALSAILTRMVRSSVIEELGEDYVRTARAKGLSENVVVYKHVLKNGLIPVVTILGLQLGVLLAGAIITEKIFGWQGLGLLLVDDGIAKRDYRLVQGCVLVISITYIVANTLTDMIYRWLDPRIRLS